MTLTLDLSPCRTRRRAPPAPADQTETLQPALPAGLLADPRLTGLCVQVWIVVDLFVSPSLDEIASMTGATPRSVERSVSRLESCGWLLVCSRAASGRNFYVAVHRTPPGAINAEARAERIIRRLTRREPEPMAEQDARKVDGWNSLCARTQRDPAAW
jgi:hypothetical protein